MSSNSIISDFFLKKFFIKNIQYLQVKPSVEKAHLFYKTHVLDCNAQLEPTLATYGFPSRLPFWKWEVFAAILVGDVCQLYTNEGADLSQHEVKSRTYGKAFEYQYHKNSWRAKLEKEASIRHVYISYWPGFRNLDIRIVDGSQLKSYFSGWEAELIEAYETPLPKQRFRRRIPFKTVMEKGKCILRIRDGRLLPNSPLLI